MDAMSSSPERVLLIRRVRGRSWVVYEIDHAGTPLSIRMAPTEDTEGVLHWSLEVTSPHAQGVVVKATDLTRAAALTNIARAWVRQADELDLPRVDWAGVNHLLNDIRAV